MKFIDSIKGKGVLKLAITIIVSISPEVLSYYAVKANTLPLIVLRFFILLGIILVSTYATPKLINRKNPTRVALTLCFVLMLLTSTFHITGTMPILTLFSIGYVMLLGAYGKELQLETLNKALFVSVCVFIPLLVYQLLHANFDMASLLRRGYTWSEVFYYTVLTNLWPAFLFSAILLKKNILPAIIYWMFAIAMNMISLKKAVFVDTAIVYSLVLYICFKTKDKKAIRNLLYVGVPFAILVVYYFLTSSISGEVVDIFDAVGNRFESSTEGGVGSDNRVVESLGYFSNEAGFFDVIFGKGLMSAHYQLEEEHYFLHIGWFNWIFKGGLILFFTILFSYKKVFKTFLHPSRYSKEKVFASLYCMYYFFILFYGNNMGFGMDLFLFFYCLTLLNERNVPKKVPQTLL